MRFGRVGALAAVAAAALIAGSGVPANAEDAQPSSICSVTADSVAGTSETTIGVRVQAFDCAGDAVPFSGDVSVAPIDDAQAYPWTYGEQAAPAAVASASGAPAVGLVDIGDLKTGFGRIVYDLTATGDPSAYPQPSTDTNNPIVLTRDPMWAGSAWTDRTHTGNAVPWVFMDRERQLWGCDAVLNLDATCALSVPTTSDQTWQKGYKLTLAWPDPGPDASGRPYSRCRVRSGVVLTASFPGRTGGTTSTSFWVTIDVPATWTSYTLPLGPDITFPSGITPGASTLDISYWCYSNRGNGTEWTGLKTADRVLVPDLPPTQPTSVAVDATDGDLTATVGGSVALGAAPLQGYQLAVVDESGATVDTASVPAAAAASVSPVSVISAVSSMSAGSVLRGSDRLAVRASGSIHRLAVRASGSSHRFSDLPSGRYTVQVHAFNAVGASTVAASRIVTVSRQAVPAPPRAAHVEKLTAPTELRVKSTRGRFALKWGRPTSVGSGIVRYTVTVRRGHHVVQRATTKAAHRAFVTKRLPAKGAYRVRVTAVSRDGRTKSVSKTIRR